MQSIRERFFNLNPIPFSLSIHSGILLIFAALLFSQTKTQNVNFEVFEQPVASSIPDKNFTPAKPQPKIIPPKKEAVFGISRNALTSETNEGESVKLGNTVVKAPDDSKLKSTDPDALPIPADDFQVNVMPKLKSEIRVPYPSEAKKKGIQGAVVLDLLIDSSGKVRQVQLVQGPGYGLNEAAAEGMKNFIFEPARIGNQAVAVKIRYSYRFIIEK